ncbi:hypothetical protein GSI_05670 [Ganoderma sinense ZZ0214-1]|uniref:BRCT domain-containing protein n=1 Tax=Ganoderma sinense ZZ0214-1 TaxID=1077348 RepID=A0A2G8SB38_9APHY|nr:hypothetical protein GSI_05670 [Ganoderma sinense ZZ0214-1]
MPHASRPAQPSSQSSTLYHDTTERLRDEPPVTPTNGRRRSQSLSYARPTSSSVAKASPVKPTLQTRQTPRPLSTSTSNSTPSGHTSAPLQAVESGGKNKPAGPFDFKSIRPQTLAAPAAEIATEASSANGDVTERRLPFGERAKTPVGVREKTQVTVGSPKVKGKERARSVGPGNFIRAKTPVSLVQIAPPQGLGRLASMDAAETVPANHAEKVLSGDEDDIATPRQGKKQASPAPGAGLGPESVADHLHMDEMDVSVAVERGVFAESDRPALDADGDTTMLPPTSSAPAQPSFEPSEDSELSELSELEDSSAAEQASFKGSGRESESDVPDDGAARPGSSVPRRHPAAGAAGLNSSLSTLSQALERLNAPIPSRPNTSLGFHRSVSSDGNDSFSSEPGTSDPAIGDKRTNLNGKAYARSRSVVPPAAAAKSKGKAIPKPTVNGRASTATGQKKLKQTTLMLPPPPPVAGTRTTRLRSAALAAANASVSGTPGSSTTTTTLNGKTPKDQEKARQVSLALAPSLGKVRAGLAANASSQTSSGSTSTAASAIPSSSGLPRTGLPSTKRTFLSSGSGRGGSSSLAKPLFGVGKLNAASGSGSGAPTRGGFGLAALRGRGGGSRVTHRASKASSLPMVVGSPVKGGDTGDAANGTGEPSDDEMVVVEEAEGMEGVQEMTTKDKIDEWLRTADPDILRDLGHGSDGEDREAGEGGVGDKSTGALSLGDLGAVDTEAGAEEKDKEKEERAKEREARRNASRRASMASHLLTQSLSALPRSTSPPRGKEKGKGRAVSSSYPSAAATQDKAKADPGAGDGEKIDAPTPPPRRAHATRLATGALSTPPNAYKERSLRSAAAGGSGLGDAEHPPGGSGSGDGKGKGKGKAGPDSPAALAVLKDCRIFVDVRTDEGDDAGSLFVDMLRDLGAKISTRVGSRCTHVVFKNGLQSTLKSYRMQSEPKPHVVGIAWVVECAEQRRKVEETRFVVNLDLMNVAGGNKRRKSMLPRNFSSPMASKIATSPPSSDSRLLDNSLNTSLGAASRSGKAANDSLEVSSRMCSVLPELALRRLLKVSSAGLAMAVDEDGDTSLPMLNPSSGEGADDEESLPPLELARRRRNMMNP